MHDQKQSAWHRHGVAILTTTMFGLMAVVIGIQVGC